MDMVNILASLNGESQGKQDFGTSFWNPAKKDIHVSISDQLDSLYKNSIFFHNFPFKSLFTYLNFIIEFVVMNQLLNEVVCHHAIRNMN